MATRASRLRLSPNNPAVASSVWTSASPWPRAPPGMMATLPSSLPMSALLAGGVAVDAQRGRVHAVALAGGMGAVGEDVP